MSTHPFLNAPMEPNFNRLRTALLCQGEPDRVPLAEGGVDAEVRAAFLGRPLEKVWDEIEFWMLAGYDYIPVPSGIRLLFTITRGFNVSRGAALRSEAVEALSQRTTASSQVRRERYGVYGDGYKERAWAEEHCGLIQTHTDLDSFAWPEAEDFDYSVWDQLGALLPTGMKAIAYQGWIFTPVWMLMGFENFSFALRENPDLIDALFERVANMQYGIFLRLLEYDCIGGFWMPDDIAYTSGLMVSPALLRKHLFPWYRRMGEECAKRGLPFIFHSDGKLDEVMPDILDCGFNALHPIEPKAMDIVTLKREYGRKLCLIGNIDLGYTLTRGAPAEVEAEVKERLRTCAPGGGYCVGSSNSVTDYVPLENFNAMREAVFKYGTYPIRV